MAKYRFKKEFQDAKIQVIGRRKTITKDNLTDEDVEYIQKRSPKHMHNFELTSTPLDEDDAPFDVEAYLKEHYKKRVAIVAQIENVELLLQIREVETSATVVDVIEEKLLELDVPEEETEEESEEESSDDSEEEAQG